MKLAALYLFSVLLLACSIKYNQPAVVSIERIKSFRGGNQSNTIDISKVYSVSGYFYNDRFPILVTDLKWTRVNSPMPDSVYLKLGGLEIDKEKITELQEKYIKITGHINPPSKNNYGMDADFLLTRQPTLQSR